MRNLCYFGMLTYLTKYHYIGHSIVGLIAHVDQGLRALTGPLRVIQISFLKTSLPGRCNPPKHGISLLRYVSLITSNRSNTHLGKAQSGLLDLEPSLRTSAPRGYCDHANLSTWAADRKSILVAAFAISQPFAALHRRHTGTIGF